MKPQRPYKRTERVGNQIQEILGEIATKYIDLSRFGFLTFTHVDISSDFRHAKIFFSVFQPTEEIEIIQNKLNGLKKAFKKYLAPELHIKNVPDLHFIFDDSLEYGNKIEELFKSLNLDQDHDL